VLAKLGVIDLIAEESRFGDRLSALNRAAALVEEQITTEKSDG
jgi:hypothetical protein